MEREVQRRILNNSSLLQFLLRSSSIPPLANNNKYGLISIGLELVFGPFFVSQQPNITENMNREVMEMIEKIAEAEVDANLVRFYFVSIPERGKVSMYIMNRHNQSFRVKADEVYDEAKGGVNGYVLGYGITDFRIFTTLVCMDVFIVLVESGWPTRGGQDACLTRLEKVVPKNSPCKQEHVAIRHLVIWKMIDLITAKLESERNSRKIGAEALQRHH